MKALKYFSLLLLLSSILFFPSCYDTEDGYYVEPITTYEKIKGNWAVTSVRQIDEIAKAASQTPSEMALTNQFNFSTFSISLNVDEKSQPTTYEIGGSSPVFFPVKGYWQLDNPFPATSGVSPIINLFEDAEKTKKNGELAITAIPGAVESMEIKFTRKTKGVAFVSYIYKLSPNQ